MAVLHQMITGGEDGMIHSERMSQGSKMSAYFQVPQPGRLAQAQGRGLQQVFL